MILSQYPHRLSISCRSGSLRDVLEYHGFPFSEAMIFGLASALSFAYVRPSSTSMNTEFVLINGSIHFDYHEVSSLLRLHYSNYFPRNDSDAWEIARQAIKDKQPVLLSTSLPIYLPYLKTSQVPSSISTPKSENQQRFIEQSQQIFSRLRTPVGNHITQLIGYDEDKNEAYILENNISIVQTIPLSVLTESRNPKIECIKSPNNEMMIFYPPKKMPSLNFAINTAIYRMVHSFLYSSYPSSGWKAIKNLKDDFPHWPELMSNDKLQNSLFMMHYLSETTGGGGFYRKLYSRFLFEAAKILGDTVLLECSTEYREIATMWRQVTNLCMNGALQPEKTTRNPELLELLNILVIREYDLARKLEAHIKLGKEND
ncbi:BtrH N-terminal domain-containing protein [Lysinibacillus sp. ZYM-1]|uniref:BtrH N-terminal domain-containing protein n=1 Tax=Lysinibacillus sp. ZYM-1 TaxID=1681184 RepID=UPI0006CE73CD|nr:BtrH N-terminal domain-containing protein [Lysinibacillus sp. ZYM-1]KPN93241.1 hypothetical protein AO843_07145 [Lysinibacillus sp. ZYM-1]